MSGPDVWGPRLRHEMTSRMPAFSGTTRGTPKGGSDMETRPPRLGGVLETSLYVADLDRAREFYQQIFALEMFFQDSRMCALGVVPGQVLLLFRQGTTAVPALVPGDVIPPHGTTGA